MLLHTTEKCESTHDHANHEIFRTCRHISIMLARPPLSEQAHVSQRSFCRSVDTLGCKTELAAKLPPVDGHTMRATEPFQAICEVCLGALLPGIVLLGV